MFTNNKNEWLWLSLLKPDYSIAYKCQSFNLSVTI